jgi:pimeloyl-ACP methyl ester carboxylesterase
MISSTHTGLSSIPGQAPPGESTIELPGGPRLSYAAQGRPDGVPVVLLHGWSDSRRSFDPVLPHLPDTIRAIAVSQRGHGDSDHPAAGYGPETSPRTSSRSWTRSSSRRQ